MILVQLLPSILTRITLCAHAQSIRHLNNGIWARRMVEDMFRNRRQAGYQLGSRLRACLKSLEFDPQQAVVYGLSSPGMLIAAEVAQFLGCAAEPLFTVELRSHENPNIIIGAIADVDSFVIDEKLTQSLDIPIAYIRAEKQKLVKQLEQQNRFWLSAAGADRVEVCNNTWAIIVDDGIMDGTKIRAAVKALRKRLVKTIIVAAPVVALRAFKQLPSVVKSCVGILTPEIQKPIREYYMDFEPASDAAVVSILKQWRDSQQYVAS